MQPPLQTRFVLFEDGTVDEAPPTTHPDLPELADLLTRAFAVHPENPPMNRASLPLPGHALTVYDRHVRDVQVANAIAFVEPHIVILHTGPGPEDLPDAVALRELAPSARLWLQTPANYLANKTPVQARALGQQLARATVDLGGEVLSFNGEGASHVGGASWASKDPTERARLDALDNALLEGAQAAEPELVIAWSSHDCPSWHALMWKSLFGENSPVGLGLHQHYPDEPGKLEGYDTCMARFRTSREQFIRQGIRADLIPGAKGAVAYTQLHGLGIDGACAIYDQAEYAAGWAVPTRSDMAGLQAAHADVLMRRAVGHAPGRVARFQASVGLKADGKVGKNTLRALGLPVPA